MSPDILVRRHRLAHLDGLFELAVMFCWFMVGLSWAFMPEIASVKSPVGQSVDGWSAVWTFGYITAAPAAAFGLLLKKVNVRVAGLIGMTTCLLVHGIATVAYSDGDPRTLVYFSYAAACGVRAFMLTRYTMNSMKGCPNAAPLD
jgi:hypothetical protein